MPTPPTLHRGFTLWLTGLSGSGKSTIANELAKRFAAAGFPVEQLDGDEIRQHLTRDLGFSLEDRKKNIERVSLVAKLLTRNRVIALASFISPTAEMRQIARDLVGNNFVEVHVHCTLETCILRDVKGHYEKALRGELPDFTGVSQIYEEPKKPEIRVHTHKKSLEECVDDILAELQRCGFWSGSLPAQATDSKTMA